MHLHSQALRHKGQNGEPLEPGKPPKIDEPINKLLVEDLQERPFVTLRERCEYVEALSGVFGEPLHDVERHSSDRFHAQKGGRSASERDEFLRAAWRVMVAATVDPSRLVFVDKMGLHTSLAPLYGYAPRVERLRLEVPRNLKARTPFFWPPSPLAGWARRWP